MKLQLSLLALLVAVEGQKQVFNIESTLPPKKIPGDAPYDISENELHSKIFCVDGVEAVANNKNNNPFLLIPGTGGNYSEHFELNYQILLGKLSPNSTVPVGSVGSFGGGLGYDVCGISPPNSMLQDVQDNAQYIAYAVAYLSQHKPIPVIGWSQGNLAFSWSVTFFKSIRAGVKQHISFAGDFAGVGTFSSAPKGKKRSMVPFGAPSVIQQIAPSQLLTNAAAKGNIYPWVKTTSLYSSADQVVQPEGTHANDTLASSFLGGNRVGNIFVQQFCPELVALHESHQFLNFSWEVVKLALASPLGFATQAMVSAANIPCNMLNAPGLGPEAVIGMEKAIIAAEKRISDPRNAVLGEPSPKAYIASASFPDNPVHDY